MKKLFSVLLISAVVALAAPAGASDKSDHKMLPFVLASLSAGDLKAVVADVRTFKDLERFRGRLSGAAVLSTPPASVDLDRIRDGVPRRTEEELTAL